MRKLPYIQTAIMFLLPLFGWTTSAQALMGKISVTVHEQGSNTPQPSRAWVQIDGTRYYKPLTKSCTIYLRDRSFSCDGKFLIEVPASRGIVHIERGKEYFPVDQKVVVSENRTTQVDIIMKRWVNMAKEGWYSADMHCHFGRDDINILKQTALADDVNLEPVLWIWLTYRSPPDQDLTWPEKSSVYADPTHLITFRNQEIERIGGESFESVGALLMSGLNKPVQ
ncbi:MAG: hypothetical protein JSV03_07640, partial [Planctomycetota bacterium]